MCSMMIMMINDFGAAAADDDVDCDDDDNTDYDEWLCWWQRQISFSSPSLYFYSSPSSSSDRPLPLPLTLPNPVLQSILFLRYNSSSTLSITPSYPFLPSISPDLHLILPFYQYCFQTLFFNSPSFNNLVPLPFPAAIGLIMCNSKIITRRGNIIIIACERFLKMRLMNVSIRHYDCIRGRIFMWLLIHLF